MDIALTFTPNTVQSDLALIPPDLVAEKDLQTAVIISLFSDRRANADDILDDPSDRRGWWGDSYADVVQDKIGSRLWLLQREKQVQSVVNRARIYCQEALQWLIDDNVAEKVIVETEIVEMGILGISVQIFKGNGEIFQSRYAYAWQQLQTG